MPRHKAARNCEIRPWLSARVDCSEGRFLQVGNSLLLCEAFQRLSSGAQILYLEMSLEAGGRREFVFPLSAAKKYGVPPRSFRRYVDELIQAGFIEKTSLKNLRQPNEYCFSFRWKEKQPP
ncbi:MAG: hypothetical protein Q4E38_03675 [Eubacteriales bacterium]|nr:hypothetical protein [Eubacteriales bacterium]